jgi:two-component system sensor histidine kinase TorS
LTRGQATLDAAARSADLQALARAAHQLKGASGNFDLPNLTARLAELEALADTGPSAALDSGLAALPQIMDQARSDVLAALGLLDGGVSQAAQ